MDRTAIYSRHTDLYFERAVVARIRARRYRADEAPYPVRTL